ncbi:MAG: hypothetical protein NVSMB6_26350 [Burkholderiaceae bacterium]
MFKDYLDVNDATLENILRETKVLTAFLAYPKTDTDDWCHDLSCDVIREAFGQPKKEDFRSMSHMCIYFAQKQNAVRRIMIAEGLLPKHPKRTKMPNNQTTFKAWARQHNY